MMNVLVPNLIVVGLLILALVITLVPMKWLAGKFGAGRAGYLACFMALFVPYLLAIVLSVALGIAMTMLQLEGVALFVGVTVLAALATLVCFYTFIRILDTNVLRGLGIAITTYLAITVITVLLFGTVALLGIGGLKLGMLTGMLGGGDLMGAGGGVATVQPAPVPKPGAKVVRELRRHTDALCDCVSAGKPCRAEQGKVTQAMARIDEVQIPAAQEEAVFKLQVRGAQCLNDAVSAQAKPTAPSAEVASGAGQQSSSPTPAVRPAARAGARTENTATSESAPVAAAAVSGGKRSKYAYREVGVQSLEQQVGKLVRITMTDGEERADILEGLTTTVVRLREGRARGGRLYELPLDGIDQIKVLDRW